MSFSQRLKQSRKRVKLSQQEVADAVGMAQTSYSELERGKSRSSSRTLQLANVLEVDPYWLATGETIDIDAQIHHYLSTMDHHQKALVLQIMKSWNVVKS